MVEIRDLAEYLKMSRSALLKSVKKRGITPTKEYRQTETGVQLVSCITDDEADRVRGFYGKAREQAAPASVSIDANSVHQMRRQAFALENEARARKEELENERFNSWCMKRSQTSR